jgi:hypothetical protein
MNDDYVYNGYVLKAYGQTSMGPQDVEDSQS